MTREMSTLKKILKIKGVGYILLGLLAGIVLLIIPAGGNTEREQAENIYKSANEYCFDLEKKTEELIKQLDGVKDCRVQITMVYGYEYLYATDQHITENFNSSGATTAKEIEKKYVVITSNNGGNTVLLREKMPAVQGIAVVCKGASYSVQAKIISLLTALYDIPGGRISVQT